MTRVWIVLAVVLTLSLPALAQDRPREPKPGISFQSSETKALQADETRNPGMLWVEQGARLWTVPDGPSNASCASCHDRAETSMKGIAARYPRLRAPRGEDGASGIVTLEAQINLCRSRQNAPPFAHETHELLGLAAFIAFQSNGMPRNRIVAEDLQNAHGAHLRQGSSLFQTRQGQMNLACTQCHDDLVGKKLRGDTISQGHTHGWPAYRLEWQTMGSLQRRLRACYLGVRAEVPAYDSGDLLALEYYLAWRGDGLPLESPGVRR